MKYLLSVVIVFSFFLVSCSKKDESKLELFSTEAFAFDTGNSWEINASTRAKGFQQNESNGKFSGSLSYQIDLFKPNGEALKGLVSKVEDISNGEKVGDAAIESQFELDSTYQQGTYRLVINVKDVLTGKTASSEAKFDLKRD